MTEKKYSRSVSQLKALSSCGERFRLERLMRYDLPVTPSPWTGLGIALHEAFCDWEKFDRQIDVCEYFLKYYNAYIEDSLEKQPDLEYWVIPPGSKDVKKSIESYRNRGLTKDVPTYRDRCLEAEWEIYTFEDGTKALELEYEIVLNGVTVKGAVDRVQWWPDGRATIEDLKSGNLEYWDQRQIGTYAYALREVYDIPVRWGRYWFTKTDQPSEWYDLARYDTDYLGELYSTLDKVVGQKLFLPNPGDHCKLCSVRPYCRENGWKEIGDQ